MAPPKQFNIGGILSYKPLSTVLAQDAAAAAAMQPPQQTAVVDNLAGLVRKHWQIARDAKQEVEKKMLDAVRSRRGEYPPEKLAEIRKTGGSEIYMLLFATKARQAKALLGDALIGAGTEKPWTLNNTPKPNLPPETVSQIAAGVQELVYQAEMEGAAMSVETIRVLLRDARDRAESEILVEARKQAESAERSLEDILVEGGWLEAMDEFIDDLTTFPTAFIKGPITTIVPTLEWQAQADGTSRPVSVPKKKLEWKRVSPFHMYPMPWSTDTNRSPLIERHQLEPSELSGLIGQEGYNEANIRAVLEAHGVGGLHQWLSIDTQRQDAEGRGTMGMSQSNLIDALQYWGSVSGRMLREWGMSDAQVPDEAKFYEVECWLVGNWVIKAVLNPDPLGRRPYYSDGYSRVPGAFWHNSLFLLIEDCVNMCNSAARALANNLGISSGPQVDINVQRLAKGETITSMYPWKIWQTTSDPMGSTAKAINFFQPDSHAAELMAVYEKFSTMADEYSGIPRYMTGVEGTPGAGRTASGLSMMIGNASKTIKQLISSIDMRVIALSVSRLYERQIQSDPEMKGDLKIVARGAMSLVTRESAQVRRNEFLMATANPIDMQIMGVEGRAEVLRQVLKTLDMPAPDKVIPSESALRMRNIQMGAMQQQGAPGGGETLMNGAPVTDEFSPMAA